MIKKAVETLFLTLGLFLLAGTNAPVSAQVRFKLTTNEARPRVDQSFLVTIHLNTDQRGASGADAAVVFDPHYLTAQEIIPGQIFSNYVFRQIDNQKGQASISGVITPGEPLFEGQGIFAQIKFRTHRDSGPTRIDFDFTPGSRNGSNVASTLALQQDLLDQAQGVTIQITQPWWRTLINKLLGWF